ncbi:MAG: super, subIIIB family protein [Sphingomonas bacterium]|nr:HAD family acid phosphatase [Sphingomonas bacterium]MDB5688869.1 super, subIIIB family protein [Sphingomonas bacterium]
MRPVALVAAGLALAGCTPVEMRRVSVPPAQALRAEPPQLRGMQYLYGSGEGAAISRQTWNAVIDHVASRLAGKDRSGVVLADDATLAAPRFVSCAGKPPAAVFDVDETVLLNLGAEADDLARGANSFDEARWDRFEKTGGASTVAAPGAAEALARLRAMGLTVIFNSNRKAANAAESRAAIEAAGLGPAVHGETLFLSGDDATGSRKDMRRARIAARFCVMALGGDQLGDFSDLFRSVGSVTARRVATGSPPVDRLWGRGWFVLPNPVYGPALAGGIDDIFPADKRWRDPADSNRKEPN